ncbi:hypothetical protein [Dyadobacter psychrotolerans]|uniref:Uncharacterized protein n=1 Tax=Dyadobacter psychrotolerans TaxID=2541721 RepID=A0A4R5DC35_9BACT|nr:hypothetical protein [Dyadobacter psychrotolerans]TDE11249.1 hypothetical protein E0F88_25375 [Dyadobacter psychrotolerans]
MSKLAVTTHDQVFAASQKISDVSKVPGVELSISSDAFSSLASVIFQKANPIELFGAAQFASDECGDAMWNEENLNPPSQK